MNNIQIFNFHEVQVRVVEKDSRPWFVLKDVCEVLDIDQVAGIKRRLTEDVISNHPLQTAGGIQQASIINEDGLYDVILESRKPEARAFRKWITGDVLPSIRKHGMYATDDLLDNPDFMIEVFQKLKNERQARITAERQIESDKPKVLFAESLQVSQDSILVADLAKILKQNGIEFGEVRLFKWLRENGYLIKTGTEYNMPTQRSMEMKLFEIKIGSRGSADGSVKITRTPKVTTKGQLYFLNKFKQATA